MTSGSLSSASVHRAKLKRGDCDTIETVTDLDPSSMPLHFRTGSIQARRVRT
jgi:hypothetical protein